MPDDGALASAHRPSDSAILHSAILPSWCPWPLALQPKPNPRTHQQREAASTPSTSAQTLSRQIRKAASCSRATCNTRIDMARRVDVVPSGCALGSRSRRPFQGQLNGGFASIDWTGLHPSSTGPGSLRGPAQPRAVASSPVHPLLPCRCASGSTRPPAPRRPTEGAMWASL